MYAKTNEEEKAELHEFIRMADKEGLVEFLKVIAHFLLLG